ncbi:terminal EAR1-like 1 [Striga hermonthica]|uniref:Terminal EAR1-like 1 n=1 Tax=Striga hermonthica TaxID=68872 RepID=A0A9N7MX05_STRHE|nr:terminal EAR1-like 1 [Striga hermonthica]
MTTLKPQYTPLNPSAPEYTPIPPGITRHPLAPPPVFLLPPPPPPAFRPQPPLCFLHHLIPTYLPPTPHHHHHHHHTQPYHAVHRTTTAHIQPPPPPEEEERVPAAQRWRPPPPPRRVRWPDDGRSRRGGSCVDHNNAAMHKNGKRSQVFPLIREEHKTTVMIRNIPYECPRKELINLMDRFCLMENAKAKKEGTSEESSSTITAYDFLYLPIDFSTKKSRGFAFVNFTSASAVWRFYQAFHLKNWDFIEPTRWTKKIEVVTAKIQGKDALVNHFSQSIFDCDSDEYLPVTFRPARDGSGQSGQLTAVGLRGYQEAYRHHKR